jgi:hypothetical protein
MMVLGHVCYLVENSVGFTKESVLALPFQNCEVHDLEGINLGSGPAALPT